MTGTGKGSRADRGSVSVVIRSVRERSECCARELLCRVVPQEQTANRSYQTRASQRGGATFFTSQARRHQCARKMFPRLTGT